MFIVGFFRSGSSLLETLLHSHGDIWGLGESSIFRTLTSQMEEELTFFDPRKEDKTDVRKLKKLVTQYSKKILQDMQKAQLFQYEQQLLDVNKEFPSDRTPKKKIVDKLLSNYWILGLIYMTFPNAIILHTMRDPLDTLFSCMSNRFGHEKSLFTLDVRALVQEYVLYLDIMDHYRRVLPANRATGLFA